jgi:MFS family permease
MNATDEIAPRRFHRPIPSAPLKACLFGLEGANSLATTYFFYFIYFYTHERFHFDAVQNFLLAAAMGLVYAGGSVYGGRFAQKAGYFASLRLGLATLAAVVILESVASTAWLAVAGMLIGNAGMTFTWPALEGMISEGESRSRLRGLVGMYNVTWAVASSIAFFTGGAMQKALGWQGMFLFPAGVFVVELVFSYWLEGRVRAQPETGGQIRHPESEPPQEWAVSPVAPRVFLNIALLANPFAYVTINTILATLPTLAERFSLSNALAAVFCSVWLFARAVAFVLLWWWPRWHYRFRYLAGAFGLMIVSFAGMLLTPGLFVLVISQVALGAALGLIYYSSLFYSMDVGETKGEHAGIHEAAIGAGSCAGPAIAATTLHFFPGQRDSGTLGVCVLLLAGLAALFWLRFRKRRA